MTKPVTILICASLVFAACGRSPTDAERTVSTMLFADTIDHDKTRFHDGAPVVATTFTRPKRPRVTCRERILPEPTTETITTTPAAVAFWNHVYFARDFYLDSYVPQDKPRTIALLPAMLYAHEMTHVWQWQNRDITGYTPFRAASEHFQSADPYLFDPDSNPNFLDYAYEQQASLVEEYLCCRALAPQAPRTGRLHGLLSQAMPLTPLPAQGREWNVYLPWKDVEIGGICD